MVWLRSVRLVFDWGGTQAESAEVCRAGWTEIFGSEFVFTADDNVSSSRIGCTVSAASFTASGKQVGNATNSTYKETGTHAKVDNKRKI